ncbi:MAG: GNAT family N-acetyltransferase, partial [Novosphingobium sp.]|nr:GNAT family N-acetyltransferase [Novosphingobium sp.]
MTTARLELWQPAVGDEQGLYALTADAAMRQHLAFAEPSLADSGARLLRSAGSWALYGYGPLLLRRPSDARIIGNCGVFHSWRGFGKGMDNVPEAGWIVARDCWGVGYAGEAMRAILAWW